MATPRYVVVDGSNIATEGRSVPSLVQLDEAVRAFMEDRPSDQVIVVVDASFGYRIDATERGEYEQAELAGEIVSPPAGAVGRGDGFLLRIADRTDAVVLSNDSFQEFHGEYAWLFDHGRLFGGKPVPGVGWIFTPRTPVRGPRSRESLRAAKKAKKAALKRAVVAEGPVAAAIAAATAEAIDPDEPAAPSDSNGDDEGKGDGEGSMSARRTRRRRSKPAGTVNDPLPFIEFIAEHPLGSEVSGEVEGFTSHGAFVRVGDARCYVPLVGLGDPPPRSAKNVLTRGEVRPFVVQALDPPRRGIELALPGAARVAGVPTEETVEADIGAGRKSRHAARAHAAPETVPRAGAAAVPAGEPAPARSRRTRKAASPPPVEAAAVAEAQATRPAEAPVKKGRVRKAEEPAAEEPAAPAAPAKATRKGAAAKKAPVVVPEPEPEPAPVAAPEPAPVAAKRRRATKATAAASAPVETEAPRQARRSRKAKAAAAAAADDTAVEPPPPKATRKRAAAKSPGRTGQI